MNHKEIFIEIPTWLGDAVMATPAIENIVSLYPNCKLTIFGSFVSTKLFLHHPNLKKIIIDNSKKEGNRYINLYKLSKSVDNIDIAFSFRKNFTTTFLMYFLDCKDKFIYKRYTSYEEHQAIRYNNFINYSLHTKTIPNKLKIYQPDITIRKEQSKLTLGINSGATYGSAKRWYPEEFAKVAIELSLKYNYDIKLFGGPSEIEISGDIEKELKLAGVTNYVNLAGKTSVEELIFEISQLDLFITNDSGPMHLAAAFSIPTVSIFGPTRDIETSQWKNDTNMLIRKEMSCSPCMKRVCPLKSETEHHKCMKDIKASDVIGRLKDESII